MTNVVNPFAGPVQFSNTNLKLTPTEATAVAAFLKSTGFTKAVGWSMLLNTGLAALHGDSATVAKAQAYVDAVKAEAAKKA